MSNGERLARLRQDLEDWLAGRRLTGADWKHGTPRLNDSCVARLTMILNLDYERREQLPTETEVRVVETTEYSRGFSEGYAHGMMAERKGYR